MWWEMNLRVFFFSFLDRKEAPPFLFSLGYKPGITIQKNIVDSISSAPRIFFFLSREIMRVSLLFFARLEVSNHPPTKFNTHAKGIHRFPKKILFATEKREKNQGSPLMNNSLHFSGKLQSGLRMSKSKSDASSISHKKNHEPTRQTDSSFQNRGLKNPSLVFIPFFASGKGGGGGGGGGGRGTLPLLTHTKKMTFLGRRR